MHNHCLSSTTVDDIMKFKPLGDMVLIAPRKMKDRTEAGVFYQEREHERYHDGIVAVIGEGVPDESGKMFPVNFKVGDRVIVDKHAGWHNVNGAMMTRRQHVIAVLEDDVEINK